ncbi:hypothetical protein Taro_049070 [Colocasia esculenta]|uniref:Uncharacterized protein n=1 Tax=Colocasia esculenta TaxID=4460 RepID=A0A843X9V6_COLES|nr:hypothetical protein [Colocasia esculenta]
MMDAHNGGELCAQAPVGLPGSSCLLMMEDVAWDGYDRSISQGVYSEPFGHAFRAGDPHGGRTCCSLFDSGGIDDLLEVIPPRGLTASDQGDGILKIFTQSWEGRNPSKWGHVS